MGALERLVARVRAKPWLAVAIAAGTLVVAAWLAWAIYVASDRGVNEGIGVLVAWPALLVAAALVAVPVGGIYLLVRRLSGESASGEASEAASGEGEAASQREDARATETG